MYLQDLGEVGGVARALVFRFIDLCCLFLGSRQLGGKQDGVAPCLVAYLVDGALQGSVACAVAFVKEVGNDRALGDDTREDDPRFLELHALAEIGAERIEHIGEQLARVGGGDGEIDRLHDLALLDVGAEAGGVGKDNELGAEGFLHAQFAGAGVAEISELLLHQRQRSDGVGKGAGGGDGLLGDQLGCIYAVYAVEFSPCEQSGLVQERLHTAFGHLGELQGSGDTQCRQFRRGLTTYAPYIADFKLGKGFQPLLVRVNHTSPVIARELFGVLACDLAEGFGGGNAHGDGDACALVYLADEILAVGLALGGRYMVEGDEALVDGVLLEARGVVAEQGHHTRGEVAVKGEIGGETSDVVFLHQVADLIEGDAHLDTQRLDLVGAADDTTVVARQDEDGLVPQVRTKHALATDEEIIAVGECVH